jgi:hypothetical protein
MLGWCGDGGRSFTECDKEDKIRKPMEWACWVK